MALREETTIDYEGLLVTREQMGLVFETLGSITGADPAKVADFWADLEPVLESQEIMCVIQRGEVDQGWPFAGEQMHILVNPMAGVEGTCLLHIANGPSKSRQLEQRVATQLGLPRAVSAVCTTIALPAEGGWFRCNMTPIVDTLRGMVFTGVLPKLSAMTGQAMANAVGALLPQPKPGQQLDPQVLVQWGPEWTFEAGDLRVVVTLLAGHPPTVENGVATHHLMVDGSVVAGVLPRGKDGVLKQPLLMVRIERNESVDPPERRLLSTDALCTQALQVSRAIASTDMS